MQSIGDCYDITGSHPVQIFISVRDPESDLMALWVQYGDSDGYVNTDNGNAFGGNISKDYSSIGDKITNIKVIDEHGAVSNIVSVTSKVVANCNPAPTVTLTASPTQVGTNSDSELSWTSTNATACVTAGDWTVPQRATSTINYNTGPLTIEKNYTYSISCTGPGGKSATSTATVTATGPITLTCTPSIETVSPNGENVTFTANIVGVSKPNYDWGVSILPVRAMTQNSSSASYKYLAVNYSPNSTGPTFHVVDSSEPQQRSASVTCASLPAYVPLNISCNLSANPQFLFTTGNTKLSWTSTNATSCSIDNVPAKDSNVPTGSLGSGNIVLNTTSTGVTRFTMTCLNPLAANTTCKSSVDVTVGDGTADAILWFDSQFTGQNGAPLLTAIQAKPPLTVNQGTDVTIKTDFDTSVIESCTGIKKSGPSGAAMNMWTTLYISPQTKTVTLTGTSLSIGTYELGLSCKGYTPAVGTAQTYPSDNTIRLKVINSVLREI